jgi:hypothetical protein
MVPLPVMMMTLGGDGSSRTCLQHLEAVDLRHHDVEQRHVERLGECSASSAARPSACTVTWWPRPSRNFWKMFAEVAPRLRRSAP